MISPPSRLPRITSRLLLAILAGSVLVMLFPTWGLPHLGLVPVKVWKEGWLWQPITYIFIHGGLWHLLFNMFSLYLFGSALERLWGERKYLVFFFICGFGAAFVSIALSPLSLTPIVGASGAIYGLLFAWAHEFPDSILYMGFVLPIRARHFIILLIFMEFFLSQAPSSIARFAHLGGLLTAWLYLRNWNWLKLARVKRAKLEVSPKQEAPLEEVDRILDKIKVHGIGSLTSKERRVLDSLSENLKRKTSA